MKAFARSLQRESEATLRAVGETGRGRQTTRIERDSGGNSKLSGVNRAKGRPGDAAVGAQFRLTNKGRTNVGGEIYSTGPLHLLANPTAGRVIRSAYATGRYRRSSKRRGGGVLPQFVGPALPGVTFQGDRRAVLNIPGIGFRRSARHPGTPGKDTWEEGKADALVAMDRQAARLTDAAARRAFREGTRS